MTMNNENIESNFLDDIPGDELLKLDNQLCFALYVTSREIIKQYKPLLDPLGLTYTAYIALLALWEKDEVTVKELGQRLYLDSGTLTPLLKKLESKGLVTRERSPLDERNVYITLTKEGHDLKEKAVHVPKSLICNSDYRNDIAKAGQLLKLLHQFMPEQ